jgi:adenosylhomocysteine nucleosidase
MNRVAIVAALEREILPLVRHWRVCEKTHSGHSFRFFESEHAVLVCGGIGANAARRATEAVIASYGPEIVYSAGFAGALNQELKVGDIIVPRRVIDVRDGSSIDTGMGEGVLVTFASIASPKQKMKLAQSFGARAVDMEAAAVALATQARGVRFAAVKAISDESDFELPALEQFVTPDGSFRTQQFAWFVAVRPWLWGIGLRLARNSARASGALCNWLQQMIASEVQASHAAVKSTTSSLETFKTR